MIIIEMFIWSLFILPYRCRSEGADSWVRGALAASVRGFGGQELKSSKLCLEEGKETTTTKIHQLLHIHFW